MSRAMVGRLRHICFMWCVWVALLAGSGAQAQESVLGKVMTVDIPAQKLTTALFSLSEQAGVQLMTSPEIVGDGKTEGVRGRMTLEAALTGLLRGTQLQFRQVGQNTISIDAPSQRGSERVLGPVRVEGAQREGATAVNGVNGSRDVTATEGTGSFTTGAMTIGSKSPRSIKDTAQSVSVITAERLDQQNINDFTTALAQAPGVTLVQGSASGLGSSLETAFFSRGFEITSLQIDGGAPFGTRQAVASGSDLGYMRLIDLSQYDHVELLRGAAGLFNGYGDPSGTINLVRKRALDHQQVMLDSEWGSWNHYRTVLDASTPLAFDGRLRGRGVVTWQSNKHFFDLAKDKKTSLYGTLDYDLTSTTLITTGISEASQDSLPWTNGLPLYQTGEDLGLPRDTCLCFPWNRWATDTTEIFGSIEQQIADDWTMRLKFTRNEQSNERKEGYSSNAVNPIDNRGPRLGGTYNLFDSTQVAAEATLSGGFTVFGQRQEVMVGANRSDQGGSGRNTYVRMMNGTAAVPYQPYPGGPRYCTPASACPTGMPSPPIDVFAFDPFDPLYTAPANPLVERRFSEFGQVQSIAYANLRLTAFDRLHLDTGLRWSEVTHKSAVEWYCNSIPTSGTPSPTNCVGRQIGDAYQISNSSFTGRQFAWPPAMSLSYDVTNSLTAYLGYTDIYVDQSSAIDGDLESLGPITGENMELGVKWSPRDGRLNAALSVYRIEKRGFQRAESDLSARYKRNPDGSPFLNASNQRVIIANDGTELPDGKRDEYHTCCYIQRNDQTQVVEGVDTELTGEVLPGWQVSASYTFSRTRQKGAAYATSEGRPFLSIQPQHLYKLWTSYDFGAAGQGGWLSRLDLSAGVNGQSSGYQSGEACPEQEVGEPNPLTGIAPCLVPLVPFEFTVKPYAVFSGRIDYRLTKTWSAAINLENIFDKTYYRSVSSTPAAGHWYGEPRSFTLNLRGSF